jgi:hypothetical protein
MTVWKRGVGAATAIFCVAVICRGEAAQIVFTHGLPVLDGGRIEAISANASKTERARFLACFTCDRKSPLTVAVPEKK